MSVEDAIPFVLTDAHKDSVFSAGWANFALGLWGHDDPERDWIMLPEPDVVVRLSEHRFSLLLKTAIHERVSLERALGYFLVFTMQELGYHV